jgi:hypothetical protein
VFKKIALLAVFAAPLAVFAADVPASAPAASAPVSHKTPGNKQHQLLAACNKKAADAGLTGDARKTAVLECMKAS